MTESVCLKTGAFVQDLWERIGWGFKGVGRQSVECFQFAQRGEPTRHGSAVSHAPGFHGQSKVGVPKEREGQGRVGLRGEQAGKSGEWLSSRRGLDAA